MAMSDVAQRCGNERCVLCCEVPALLSVWLAAYESDSAKVLVQRILNLIGNYLYQTQPHRMLGRTALQNLTSARSLCQVAHKTTLAPGSLCMIRYRTSVSFGTIVVRSQCAQPGCNATAAIIAQHEHRTSPSLRQVQRRQQIAIGIQTHIEFSQLQRFAQTMPASTCRLVFQTERPLDDAAAAAMAAGGLQRG